MCTPCCWSLCWHIFYQISWWYASDQSKASLPVQELVCQIGRWTATFASHISEWYQPLQSHPRGPGLVVHQNESSEWEEHSSSRVWLGWWKQITQCIIGEQYVMASRSGYCGHKQNIRVTSTIWNWYMKVFTKAKTASWLLRMDNRTAQCELDWHLCFANTSWAENEDTSRISF